MDGRTVITIGREFGSGGHVAGQLIADQLSIPYYDNELITMAIRHGGITHGRPLIRNFLSLQLRKVDYVKNCLPHRMKNQLIVFFIH